MGTLWQDFRYGLRMLAKAPGFAVATMLTLSLGIGANTAIFGLANAAFFRPLPFPHADRLAFLWQNNHRTGESEGAVSYPNYADWRAQSHSFQGMAFVMFAQEILNGSGTQEVLNGANGPERVAAALVSTNFFSVMGVNPILGRSFVAGDSLRGKTSVVVISYALWKSRFGGDPHALGRRLGFSDTQGDTIIGVMPRGFSFPEGAQLWKPREVESSFSLGKFDMRQYPNMGVIGRRNAGVTWVQAQTEMDTIAQRLAQEYPKDDSGIGVRVVPLRVQLSQKVRQGLFVLWGAIFGVLLIACLNAANLMMARAAGRQKEIAVRFSLGATRARIVNQFLAESLLLACSGAVLGFFLGSWTVALVAKFNPAIARLGGSVLDVRVLGYTVAITAFTALVCGIFPAFSASRMDLNRALKETSTGAASPGAQMIRRILIVAEVSLAFVLLAGSGLLIRSLWQIFSVRPGFDADKVFSLRIYFPPVQGTTADANARFMQIMNRIRALPGVTAVGSTSNVLFPGEMHKVPFLIEGREAEFAAQKSLLSNGEATPDFFRSMGIPLLRGRVFTDADTPQNAPPVAIINEAMARRYWPNEDPIGKQFKFNDPNFKSPWFTIVGVVGDIRQEGLEKSAETMAYLPSSGYYDDDLVVRTNGNSGTLLAAIKDQVRAVDKNLAVDHFEAASAILSEHESQRKFDAWLLGAFAFIALLLAAVGIYGTVSYWVKQRTQEIGIRVALGAQRKDIFGLVVTRGMALIVAGIVLGIAAALAVTRILATMLFGVQPTDPFTYTAVALLLAGAGLAACYFPARRAMRVDPMEALRYE
ncbi:MAG TPA: ABC transporter permease [Candidatus Dormibacteraeota bacterium]|nr:ABC transporter permease [Candidatus Dormibacteraeota bacterium]